MERFWSKVHRTDGCWLWTAGLSSNGYGKFYVDGKTRGAHAVSLEMATGESADGMCVCHRCDNKRCVRPDHLFLGTHQDNQADKVAKGRQANGEMLAVHARSRRGDRHWSRIHPEMWAARNESAKHWDHSSKPKGECHYRSVLSNAQYANAKMLRALGAGRIDVAEWFGVSVVYVKNMSRTRVSAF